MQHVERAALGGFLMVAVASLSAPLVCVATAQRPVTRHEVVAIYFGTTGTDSLSGMVPAIQAMKSALARQAAATGRRFISRGVSLDPGVDAGQRHLALFGGFDEMSLGGNWTNPEVIHYLGPRFDTTRTSGIPQLVLVERQVTQDLHSLQVGPEREIARFIGTMEIDDWVRRGAPLPR